MVLVTDFYVIILLNNLVKTSSGFNRNLLSSSGKQRE
jgi:hypothetical protein